MEKPQPPRVAEVPSPASRREPAGVADVGILNRARTAAVPAPRGRAETRRRIERALDVLNREDRRR